MAVVEHPSGLMSEQHHAFAERVAWHTAFVINGARTRWKSRTGQNFEQEGIGVGTACLWNDTRIILTAKHVVEDAHAADLRFLLRATGGIDWAVKPAERSLAFPVSLEVSSIVSARSEDLACIVLSGHREHRLEFVELPNCFAKVPPSGGGTLLYGCPYDQNIPMAAARRESALHVGFAAQPRGCWAAVMGEIPPISHPRSILLDIFFCTTIHKKKVPCRMVLVGLESGINELKGDQCGLQIPS